MSKNRFFFVSGYDEFYYMYYPVEVLAIDPTQAAKRFLAGSNLCTGCYVALDLLDF